MRNVNEWRTRGGVNRLIAILLAMIGVMLVLIAIPWWKSFRYRSECIACEQAMDSAKDGLIIDYLHNRPIDGTVYIDDGMKARMEEYLAVYGAKS